MKQIAVVEDEPLMREELALMLRKAGYEAIEIGEFDHVTEQLEKISPDLVVLDINLPGVSGFQICREIKGRSSFPVLVLTSRDQMRDELYALELGADEYLTKPCRRERLLARVSNVLKRYEGRANLLEGAGFLLDRQTYTLYINNSSTVLPKNQGKLLETFLSSKDRISMFMMTLRTAISSSTAVTTAAGQFRTTCHGPGLSQKNMTSPLWQVSKRHIIVIVTLPQGRTK